MKHSPGPWRWTTAGGPVVVSGEGRILAEVTMSGGLSNDESIARGEADAALIALAPDMREMLLELEWAGGEAGDLCPCCGREQPSVPGPGAAWHIPGERGGHAPDCRLAILLEKLR